MTTRLALDYLELSGPDMAATTAFLTRAFGWHFNDYGPDYQEFADAGQAGGVAAGTAPPLPILKADDLEAALAAVEAAGGTVTRPILAFPGGRRLHLREPGGTEMAVWSAR